MKAYLIDPSARAVSEIEYDGELDTLYKIIGCDRVDAARFGDDGDAVFVDDEFLYKEHAHWFRFPGHHETLAGKGVVLGCDDEGDTTAPRCSLQWVKDGVEFFEQLGDRLYLRPAA